MKRHSGIPSRPDPGSNSRERTIWTLASLAALALLTLSDNDHEALGARGFGPEQTFQSVCSALLLPVLRGDG
jgi:hypothetical protein